MSSLIALFLFLACFGPVLATQPESNCKCFPGDECWPTQREWAHLNSTVGGRLIATVPLGSPCHDPAFDEQECASLQDQWLAPTVHMKSSSSVMAPLFANQSCDPFQPRKRPCELGNYVRYAVNASGPSDIVAALRFAETKNIRFVIRNTGHDYLGRSTGAGALSVWTHYLKGTEVLGWEDSLYHGQALRVGAGVQGFEALKAVHAAGLVVVTGECPTVGLAGGYTQGGGHSALSTVYGLAADNVLEFEVVTPTGKLVKASRTENHDLYWALSGGGGGNYGVVTSMTVRAHPDSIVSGASFVLAPSTDKPEQIYDIIDAFHAALPEIVDAGVMIIYYFSNTSFQVSAMTAHNKTRAEAKEILEPLNKALAAINITLNATFTEFPSYYNHYDNYWGPLPAGVIPVGTQLFGGRLIPRSSLSSFGPTARRIAEMGVTFIGVGLDVSRFGGNRVNSVLPQWRDSIVHASLTLPWSFTAPWEDMLSEQSRMMDEIQPVIEAATPGGGAYMNEADFQQRDWQTNFFGANYDRLLQIKKEYDPEGLLYATVAVGSEQWRVEEDGRMCRAAEAHSRVEIRS